MHPDTLASFCFSSAGCNLHRLLLQHLQCVYMQSCAISCREVYGTCKNSCVLWGVSSSCGHVERRMFEKVRMTLYVNAEVFGRKALRVHCFAQSLCHRSVFVECMVFFCFLPVLMLAIDGAGCSAGLMIWCSEC